VSLNLYPIETRWSFHAVVIKSVSETNVVYLDPLSGNKQANQTAFEQAWQMRRGKALLINP
jgi:predicted double-glycine peptidase